jgi:hypothetical protein
VQQTRLVPAKLSCLHNRRWGMSWKRRRPVRRRRGRARGRRPTGRHLSRKRECTAPASTPRRAAHTVALKCRARAPTLSHHSACARRQHMRGRSSICSAQSTCQVRKEGGGCPIGHEQAGAGGDVLPRFPALVCACGKLPRRVDLRVGPVCLQQGCHGG